jgi:hypothetical protein
VLKDEEVAGVFLDLLNSLSGRLPESDIKNVDELVAHNESGVALEILCAQLFEYDIPLSKSELRAISSLSNVLDCDISAYTLQQLDE